MNDCNRVFQLLSENCQKWQNLHVGLIIISLLFDWRWSSRILEEDDGRSMLYERKKTKTYDLANPVVSLTVIITTIHNRSWRRNKNFYFKTWKYLLYSEVYSVDINYIDFNKSLSSLRKIDEIFYQYEIPKFCYMKGKILRKTNFENLKKTIINPQPFPINQ